MDVKICDRCGDIMAKAEVTLLLSPCDQKRTWTYELCKKCAKEVDEYAAIGARKMREILKQSAPSPRYEQPEGGQQS